MSKLAKLYIEVLFCFILLFLRPGIPTQCLFWVSFLFWFPFQPINLLPNTAVTEASLRWGVGKRIVTIGKLLGIIVSISVCQVTHGILNWSKTKSFSAILEMYSKYFGLYKCMIISFLYNKLFASYPRTHIIQLAIN